MKLKLILNFTTLSCLPDKPLQYLGYWTLTLQRGSKIFYSLFTIYTRKKVPIKYSVLKTRQFQRTKILPKITAILN